jgi:hypothetical protein
MAEIRIKYYGLERDFTGKGEVWTKVGIIGAPETFNYAQIREALDLLTDFRVIPILVQADWTEVFQDGRLISFKELLTAIKVLGTK